MLLLTVAAAVVRVAGVSGACACAPQASACARNKALRCATLVARRARAVPSGVLVQRRRIQGAAPSSGRGTSRLHLAAAHSVLSATRRPTCQCSRAAHALRKRACRYRTLTGRRAASRFALGTSARAPFASPTTTRNTLRCLGQVQ